MNSHQGNILADVSHDQGDGILTTLAAIQDLVLKPNDLEFAPFRGELGSGHNLEASGFSMVVHGLEPTKPLPLCHRLNLNAGAQRELGNLHRRPCGKRRLENLEIGGIDLFEVIHILEEDLH